MTPSLQCEGKLDVTSEFDSSSRPISISAAQMKVLNNTRSANSSSPTSSVLDPDEAIRFLQKTQTSLKKKVYSPSIEDATAFLSNDSEVTFLRSTNSIAAEGDQQNSEQHSLHYSSNKSVTADTQLSRFRKRRSGKGKRRPRGTSLEREVSKAILQTAASGAEEAHFLVQSQGNISANNVDASFILDDLVAETSKNLHDTSTSSEDNVVRDRILVESANSVSDLLEEEEPEVATVVPNSDPPKLEEDTDTYEQFELGLAESTQLQGQFISAEKPVLQGFLELEGLVEIGYVQNEPFQDTDGDASNTGSECSAPKLSIHSEIQETTEAGSPSPALSYEPKPIELKPSMDDPFHEILAINSSEPEQEWKECKPTLAKNFFSMTPTTTAATTRAMDPPAVHRSSIGGDSSGSTVVSKTDASQVTGMSEEDDFDSRSVWTEFQTGQFFDSADVVKKEAKSSKPVRTAAPRLVNPRVSPSSRRTKYRARTTATAKITDIISKSNKSNVQPSGKRHQIKVKQPSSPASILEFQPETFEFTSTESDADGQKSSWSSGENHETLVGSDEVLGDDERSI